ncbi:hypothetical protein MPSEU_001080300 [Mayamaea pseudoterrestris]|nr:hypothetical protein MPSEU_001080300 [Mayamaea pseudoterrestris]
MTLPLIHRSVVSFASPECSVRIDDTIPCLDDMSDENKACRYFTPTEFSNIKLHAKLETRDVRRTAAKGVQQMEDTLDAAERLAISMTTSVTGHFAFDPFSHAQDLYLWNTMGDGRGLEKYVSQKQRRHRSETVKRSVRTVVHLSQECHANANDIAQEYRNCAASSLVYASIMGTADALAVKEHDSIATTTGATPLSVVAMQTDDPVSSNDQTIKTNGDYSEKDLPASSNRQKLHSRPKSPKPNAERKRVILTTVAC